MIEHPEFHTLLRLAQAAPSCPELPSARTITRRLQGAVKNIHQDLLQKLPPNAKLSIALDCWTSPFQQAFMAITGYFIDQDWNYREILLAFEPLHGSHSGANLSTVLLDLLQQHQIVDRVLAVTTDNASNNTTLINSIQESIQALELENYVTTIRIPCIAHIIQLSLRKLLGQVKANPKNEMAERVWSEARSQLLHEKPQNQEIAFTLAKVSHLALSSLYLYLTNYYFRFVAWRSLSMLVLNAEMHF